VVGWRGESVVSLIFPLDVRLGFERDANCGIGSMGILLVLMGELLLIKLQIKTVHILKRL
jgi:hypothetical protein